MLLNTRFFGKVEIEKDKVITFIRGILGFEDIKKYVMFFPEKEESPFVYLQALEKEDLCFVMINPKEFFKDYFPQISSKFLQSLKCEKQEDILYYTILTVPENPENMRTNLKAPIVINPLKKLADQVVLDEDKYPTRYYIMKEMLKLKKEKNKAVV